MNLLANDFNRFSTYCWISLYIYGKVSLGLVSAGSSMEFFPGKNHNCEAEENLSQSIQNIFLNIVMIITITPINVV